MAKVRINYKLIIVLVIGLVLLAGSAIGLRKWFRTKTVSGGYADGKRAYEQGDWAEATDKLGKYIAVRKDDVEILKMYAQAQLNIRPVTQGNVQQAISAYRQITRLDPNDVEAVQKITDIYLSMRAYNEVKSKAEEFLASGEDPNISLNLAKALIGLRRFEEANHNLMEIVEKYPNFIPAYEILAAYSMRRPEHFETDPQVWYEKAITNNPESAMAYIIRGAWNRMNNDKEATMADLKVAEKLDIENFKTTIRLAREYVLAEEPNKAIEILEHVQKQNEDDIDLWTAKSLAALAKEDKKLMVATADQALEKLGYKSWDFLELATELYINGEDYAKAEKTLDKMSSQGDNRAQALFFRGLIESQKNNKLKAAELLREAVDLGYKTSRARILLAQAYSETGDLSSGIQQLRALVNEMPDSFQAHVNLAKLLSQNDDPTSAAEEAQQALQINPSSSEAMMLFIRNKSKSLTRAGVPKNHAEWISLEEKVAKFAPYNKEMDDVIIFNKFKLALYRSDVEKAKRLFQNLENVYPDSMQTQLAKTELLLNERDIDAAKAEIEKMIENYPDRGEPYSYMVQILLAEGKYDECLLVAKDAIGSIENESSRLQLALVVADIAKNIDQEESVIELLKTVYEQFPESVTLKRKLLTFEEINSDPEQAAKIIEEIKEIEGNDGWQWKYEKAKSIYLAEGQKDSTEMTNLLEEAANTNPSNLEISLLRGAAYVQKNDLVAAVSTYKQALARWPSEPKVIIPLISLLYQTENFTEAEELISHASELKIQDPTLDKLQVYSLMKGGSYQDVSELLNSLIENDPNDNSLKLSLALLYLREKKFDQSQELLDQIDDEERSFSVEVAKIELLNAKGDFEQSMRAADELIERFGTAQSYITRGRNFVMIGKNDLAEKDFLKAVEVKPENIECWLVLTDFYRISQNDSKARETINKAISKMPENTNLLKKAIILYGASGSEEDLEHSGELIDQALSANPEDVDLRLLKSRFLISTRNNANVIKAVEILEGLIETYPNVAGAWQLLANVSIQNNNPDRALFYCEKGLAHSPSDPQLLLLKAKVGMETSPFSAVKILNDLLERNPGEIDIIIPLAQAHIKTGNINEAIEMLKQKIETANLQDKRRLNLMLATAYEKDRQSERATEIFEKLAEDSDDEALLYTRANLLIEESKWADLIKLVSKWSANNKDNLDVCHVISRQLIMNDEMNAKATAEDILKRLRASDPTNLETLSNLGLVYQLNGKPAESADIYEEILNIQPNNIVAINNLAWILAENKGEFDKAVQLATRGLELAPNYEDLYDTRGVIYYRMGEYDKAVEDFQNNLKLIPPGKAEAAGAYFHLGRLYAEIGNSSKAVENLNRAISLDPEGDILSASDISTIRRLLYKLKGGR